MPQFAQLFGDDVINGSIETELQEAGLAPTPLPSQECVSIADEIERIGDLDFQRYFSAEVPLYLSQGCRFSCTFCGAERSHTDLRVRERYRSVAAVEAELRQIVKRSVKAGITQNTFYLSNLDVFQTPSSLLRFIECIENVLSEFPGHKLRFRGLSTTSSFMTVYRKSPELIERFIGVGLAQVGFGIDGATPDVWRAIRKPHSKSDCLDAVAVAREVFDLQPEALMVFGHDGHDDTKSLILAVDTVRFLSDQYGAIPRPHVAKGLVPGNDGWRLPDGDGRRRFLLEQPWAFQFLDFTCLPTDITHPEPDFRAAVETAFLKICEMPNCLTQYVLPEDLRLPAEKYAEATSFNKGRFDI
jgi:hypothetical protein